MARPWRKFRCSVGLGLASEELAERVLFTGWLLRHAGLGEIEKIHPMNFVSSNQ